MKTAILLHGTTDSPGAPADYFWLPWLKTELEAKGYHVWMPRLPLAERPQWEVSLAFLQEHARVDRSTVMVGHSSGCPTILSFLERTATPIAKAVLVAGFSAPLKPGKLGPILQSHYDWTKIRANCRQFYFINSDNDPWGCDDAQGRLMQHHLGGTLIIPHGEGHMGSSSYGQPYPEFPLVGKLVEG